MSYTPGPWKYQLKVLCKGIDDAGNKLEPYTIQDYYAIESGEGFWGSAEDPRGFDIQAYMKESDARLISAAPDLLAALEFIVNDLIEPGEDAHLSTEGYNKACAAIKKATSV